MVNVSVRAFDPFAETHIVYDNLIRNVSVVLFEQRRKSGFAEQGKQLFGWNAENEMIGVIDRILPVNGCDAVAFRSLLLRFFFSEDSTAVFGENVRKTVHNGLPAAADVGHSVMSGK